VPCDAQRPVLTAGVEEDRSGARKVLTGHVPL
jgi:hypothetical protein